MNFRAIVTVMLRPDILDVQGKTVEHALHSLHLTALSDVRIGKSISLSVNAADADQAYKIVREACTKLLANPVMEDFTITVETSSAGEEAGS